MIELVEEGNVNRISILVSLVIVAMSYMTGCSLIQHRYIEQGIAHNLTECIASLDHELSAEVIEQIRSGTEDDLIDYHFGLGMWIRNNFGLWGDSPLAGWFNRLGVFHPDDMSSIILTSYYRHVNGLPIGLSDQLEPYQGHWKSVSQREAGRALQLLLRIERESDDKGTQHFKAVMAFTNTGRDTIQMDFPECLGVHIWPTIINDQGETLQLRFRVRANCHGGSQTLGGGQTVDIPFPYLIDSCFQLKEGERYSMSVDYIGEIRCSDGSKRQYESALASNFVEIRP